METYGIHGNGALKVLQERFGFTEARARRILNIAWEHGLNAEAFDTPDRGRGLLRIYMREEMRDRGQNALFTFEVHSGKSTSERVVKRTETEYTQDVPSKFSSGKARITKRKAGMAMPPKRRTTTKAAEPEAEVPEENGEVDFQKYLDKNPSPTMLDYVEWMEANVGNLDEIPSDRLIMLGIQLYSHFQKSDFNVERREARRAEREAASEPEEPEEPEKPARGRGARTAPAKPATARRSPRSGNGKAPGPARRKRAASSEEESPAATF